MELDAEKQHTTKIGVRVSLDDQQYSAPERRLPKMKRGRDIRDAAGRPENSLKWKF